MKKRISWLKAAAGVKAWRGGQRKRKISGLSAAMKATAMAESGSSAKRRPIGCLKEISEENPAASAAEKSG
jgi:hypothetical protein